jgi:hypothetical protein
MDKPVDVAGLTFTVDPALLGKTKDFPVVVQ